MNRLPSLACFTAIAALAATACGDRDRDRPAGPPPPRAEFLVAAGDSTYWVLAAPEGIRRRGSSMMLARVGSDFYEIYTADEDRSFYDALFVGQRVYRRDLVTGDSALVYRDTIVPEAQHRWAASHPGESPLLPDEDANERPASNASAEVELLDVHDAYLSLEHHTDLDVGGVRHMHRTVRRVVDLRSRRAATIRAAFGDSAGQEILARGAALFAAARDSIRENRDPRTDEARDAATDLVFDPRSFSLSEIEGDPAVTFVVPGIGEHTTGTALPLAPIAASAPPWWSSVVPTLPSARESMEDRWTGKGYTVRARYRTAGEFALLSLSDSEGHEWLLGRIPVPVRRVLWLDAPVLDSLHRDALARAFDDAVLYDDAARLARRGVDAARVGSHLAPVRAAHRQRLRAAATIPVSRRLRRSRMTRPRHIPT